MLLRISAPHFCAGLDTEGPVAPILKYMRGWTPHDVTTYCRRKGWHCEEVVIHSTETATPLGETTMAKKPTSNEAVRRMAEKARRGEPVSWNDVSYDDRSPAQQRADADAAATAQRNRDATNRINRAVENTTRLLSPAYDQRMSTHDMSADVPHPMTKKSEFR